MSDYMYKLQEERKLSPLERYRLPFILRPADEWREVDGDVLWWHLPICEPPIVGSHQCMGTKDAYGDPTDCARLQEEGWLTHWSPLPCEELLESSDGVTILD